MTVQLRNETIEIYNVYHHPGFQLEAGELLSLCSTASVFIGGDFNAHHHFLGSTSNNRKGHHLAECMENIPEATLLNTIEPTHIAGGILDLSFTSSHLSREARWGTHEYLASDHFAITISLKSIKQPPPLANPRWNTKKSRLDQVQKQALTTAPYTRHWIHDH